MIAAPMRKNLLALATAFAKANGLSLAQVSKKVYGNSAFFEELKRKERSVSFDKAEEMVKTFQAEWPDGLAWPHMEAAIISRPPEKSPG